MYIYEDDCQDGVERRKRDDPLQAVDRKSMRTTSPQTHEHHDVLGLTPEKMNVRTNRGKEPRNNRRSNQGQHRDPYHLGVSAGLPGVREIQDRADDLRQKSEVREEKRDLDRAMRPDKLRPGEPMESHRRVDRDEFNVAQWHREGRSQIGADRTGSGECDPQGGI